MSYPTSLPGSAEGIPSEPKRVSYGLDSAKGGIVTSVVHLAVSAINFSVQLVLAWFLIPEQFGLVAFASSFTNTIAVFRDGGATQVLIHRQSDLQRLASSVFWLCLGASLLCSAVTIGFAPALAHFFGRTELIPILGVLAIRFPVGALGVVSQVKLMVDLRWTAIAFTTLISTVIYGAVSILMAKQGYGVYSLIVPPILGDAIKAAVFRKLSGAQGNWHFEPRVILSLLGTSSLVLGTGLTLAIRGQSDYFILGLLSDETSTGFYFFAFTTAAAVSRLSIGGLSSILTPVFVKMREDKERREAAFHRAMHAYALVGCLPMVLQAFLAMPLFRLLLQERWQPASILFLVLSLLHLAKFLNSVAAQAMNAEGRFRTMFLFSAIFMPFEVGMFALGAYLGGAIGLAVFACVSALMDFLVWNLISLRILNISRGNVLLPLWRPLAASAPAALIAMGFQFLFPGTFKSDVLTIVASVALGSLLYLGILKVLWPVAFRDVWQMCMRLIRRSRA